MGNKLRNNWEDLPLFQIVGICNTPLFIVATLDGEKSCCVPLFPSLFVSGMKLLRATSSEIILRQTLRISSEASETTLSTAASLPWDENVAAVKAAFFIRNARLVLAYLSLTTRSSQQTNIWSTVQVWAFTMFHTLFGILQLRCFVERVFLT